jgi:UDP-N-acetylmuramate--alanine ligase
MNLNQIHNVYFIGIGGIGMSALAPILKISGNRFLVMINAYSFDKRLIESGIAIHFEDSIDDPKDYFIENTSYYYPCCS